MELSARAYVLGGAGRGIAIGNDFTFDFISNCPLKFGLWIGILECLCAICRSLRNEYLTYLCSFIFLSIKAETF